MSTSSESSFLRSHNPVLKEKRFQSAVIDTSTVMSAQGTAIKALLLLILVVAAGSITWTVTWNASQTGDFGLLFPLMLGGSIGGLILAVVLVFKTRWAPFLAPLYAVLQGLMLGVFSAFFELSFPGIVLQAVMLTVAVLFLMLTLYLTRLVVVTPSFRLGVMLATMAIGLVYLATFILSLFGVAVPFIHQSGWIGIAFSLVVVGVASLNLLLDFDFIERASESGAPKYMEWFGAFGLMVTLIWLYMEILRLLGRLRSR